MEPFGFDQLPEAVRQLTEKVERLQELLLNLQPQNEGSNKMLGVEEAASFLGISAQAIYTMASRSIIPYHKPGKRLYFDRHDLEEWIRLGRKNNKITSPKLPRISLRPARRRY